MIEKNNKLRVTDIITEDEVKKWGKGGVITISAGTGRGKSHFIKTVLYKFAKAEGRKILMLLHRENAVTQFNEEIKDAGKEDVIRIQTYQKLENDILNNKPPNLQEYQYICADEFHYFLNDAEFNKTTDLSFCEILECKSAVRIYMSATGEKMKDYINCFCNTPTIDYEIPLDFSFIKSLNFFFKGKDMVGLINQVIANNEKAIIFIKSAEKAYNLSKKFGSNCLFNCSKYNPAYYKYVDKPKIAEMLKAQKFEENVLITTACFDAGVNIIDEKIKTISADILDINTLIQCIGRKRIDYSNPDDKINLYIKAVSNSQIDGYRKKAEQKIEKPNFLLTHNTKEYVRKYGRKTDGSGIIYDDVADDDNNEICTKKVNKLMLKKKENDIAEYRSMIQLGNWGYCEKLAKLFRFYDYEREESTYQFFYDNTDLELYLKNHLNQVMLRLADRKELVEQVDVRSDGKRLKSIESINDTLFKQRSHYRISKFATSRVINGQKKKFKQAWKIVESELC